MRLAANRKTILRQESRAQSVEEVVVGDIIDEILIRKDWRMRREQDYWLCNKSVSRANLSAPLPLENCFAGPLSKLHASPQQWESDNW